jgi:MFS family permease
MVSAGRIHLLNFSRRFAVTAVFFLAPLHFHALGFSGWQIGLAVFGFAAAPLIFSFPMGWINDRISMGGVIRAAWGALVCLLALMSSARGLLPMAALYLGLGVANNALDVSINSLYFKDESKGDQNRKYGVYAFWGALGPAAGVLTGGVLMNIADFRAFTLVLAGFLAVASLACRRLGEEKFAAVPAAEYLKGLFRRKTLLFTLLLFIIALHWGAEGTVYSLFLKDHFGLGPLALSIYISGALFLLSLAALFVGHIPYNPDVNRKLFLTGMVLSGAGHMLMILGDVRLSFFFRVVHEIGDGLMGALVFLYIAGLFDRRNIGGGAGIILSVQTAGHMTGSLVFPALGQHFGLPAVFLVSGALLLANAVLGSFVFRNDRYD